MWLFQVYPGLAFATLPFVLLTLFPPKSLSLVFPFPSFHLYFTISPPIQWFLSNSLYSIDIPGI